MKDVNFRKVWPELLCLVPVYAEDGTNGTEIHLTGSAIIFSPYKTKTVVRQLAHAFTIDLKAIRDVYAGISGRSYTVPIPIHPELVLVPIRSRHALAKDDGTRAYVVQRKLARVEQIREQAGEHNKAQAGKQADKHYSEQVTRLIFVDGTHLDVLHRWSSLKVLLAQSDLVAREVANVIGGRPSLSVAESLTGIKYGRSRGSPGE